MPVTCCMTNDSCRERTRTFICPYFDRQIDDRLSRALVEAVETIDFIGLEAATSRMRTSARRHCEDNGDFVWARRIAEGHGHRIVVRTDIKRVLVSQRDVDRDSRATAFSG